MALKIGNNQHDTWNTSAYWQVHTSFNDTDTSLTTKAARTSQWPWPSEKAPITRSVDIIYDPASFLYCCQPRFSFNALLHLFHYYKHFYTHAREHSTSIQIIHVFTHILKSDNNCISKSMCFIHNDYMTERLSSTYANAGNTNSMTSNDTISSCYYKHVQLLND